MTPPRLKIPLRRKLIYFAVFLGFSCLLALLGAELLARVVSPVKVPWIKFWPGGYYVAAPDCQYHLSANFKRSWMKSPDGKTRNLLYTNSLGMRDVEPPPPDGPRLRILCLGCSYTEGLGITAPSQPWPRQLDKYLNATAGDRPTTTPVVVMNGGVVGYNTFQQVAHGVHLTPAAKPDIWLMAYMGGRYGMWPRNAYGPTGQYRLRWGSLWEADQLAKVNAGHGASSIKLMDLSYLWRLTCLIKAGWQPGGDYTTSSLYGQRYDDATLDALTLFKQSAQRLGVRPVVAYLPTIEEVELALKGEDFYVLGKVRDLCARLEIEFHNLRDPLVAEARRLKITNLPQTWEVSSSDRHYNPECNKIFARALAAQLRPMLPAWSAQRNH